MSPYYVKNGMSGKKHPKMVGHMERMKNEEFVKKKSLFE